MYGDGAANQVEKEAAINQGAGKPITQHMESAQADTFSVLDLAIT